MLDHRVVTRIASGSFLFWNLSIELDFNLGDI